MSIECNSIRIGLVVAVVGAMFLLPLRAVYAELSEEEKQEIRDRITAETCSEEATAVHEAVVLREQGSTKAEVRKKLIERGVANLIANYMATNKQQIAWMHHVVNVGVSEAWAADLNDDTPVTLATKYAAQCVVQQLRK